MDEIEKKLRFLRDKFKNPPGVGGNNQERKIREQKKLWKKEASKLARRHGKEELRDCQ